jgi:hypothetical protein
MGHRTGSNIAQRTLKGQTTSHFQRCKHTIHSNNHHGYHSEVMTRPSHDKAIHIVRNFLFQHSLTSTDGNTLNECSYIISILKNIDCDIIRKFLHLIVLYSKLFLSAFRNASVGHRPPRSSFRTLTALRVSSCSDVRSRSMQIYYATTSPMTQLLSVDLKGNI